MAVDALPGVLVGIKGEVSSKEEDTGTSFAMSADPSASQRQMGNRAAGQHRGALLCGAVHQGTHRAGVDVML